MEYTYKYPRPAVTADCVVMTAGEDTKVLLVERGNEPYKGCWAFSVCENTENPAKMIDTCMEMLLISFEKAGRFC